MEVAHIMIHDENTKNGEIGLVAKRILLIGSTNPDNLILAWDLDKMKPYKRLNGHTSSVSSIRDLQDEATIVSASFDHKIAFWDLRSSFKCLKLLEIMTSPVLCMEYD